MKPLAGVFLALACVLGIASTGCVFELAYGDPDLGVKTTSWILALAALERWEPFCSPFA